MLERELIMDVSGGVGQEKNSSLPQLLCVASKLENTPHPVEHLVLSFGAAQNRAQLMQSSQRLAENSQGSMCLVRRMREMCGLESTRMSAAHPWRDFMQAISWKHYSETALPGGEEVMRHFEHDVFPRLVVVARKMLGDNAIEF